MSIPSDFQNLLDKVSRINLVGDGLRSELATDDTTSGNKPYSENVGAKLDSYFAAAAEEKKVIDPKITRLRETLPIFQRKQELLQAMEENQVLIIIGETGSGKTTQIPQYLKEIGMSIKGRIGCTQLRRMAAKAVAKRVAREQGCKVGEEVGYIIRFEDETSERTQIQYMTDGILLRECTYDRLLTSYSAIILDESHERTIDTDVLLGVLRWIVTKRNDIKLIISSATLDCDKFSSYFFNAAVFNVRGRMYPVDIVYNSSMVNYVSNASALVIRINETQPRGDILVFMSGEGDIEELADYLYDYQSSLHPTLNILPCYSALSWDEQAKIFKPAENNERKVVIATNIAETSLTVDGIHFVIDSGYVKQKVYNQQKEIEELKRIRVSQAQAIQRAGRAGRTAPGKCYRLYTKNEFDGFVSGQMPEIKRSSLTNAVLLLKKMGFKDLREFTFLDSPPEENIKGAEEELQFFGAINMDGEITEVGRKMSSFPLDPNLAKMLIVSESLDCAEEVLTIVALLSVPNIFIRRKKKQKQADAAKARFFTSDGDLIMMMNVYNEWLRNDRDKKWSFENYVQGRILNDAFKIREQLREIMISKNMAVKSTLYNSKPILKTICSGFFQNVAQNTFHRNHTYTTLPKHEPAFIHPGSCMFRLKPSWVVFQKIIQTNKPYMRGVTPIDVQWLKEFAPAFYISGSLPMVF